MKKPLTHKQPRCPKAVHHRERPCSTEAMTPKHSNQVAVPRGWQNEVRFRAIKANSEANRYSIDVGFTKEDFYSSIYSNGGIRNDRSKHHSKAYGIDPDILAGHIEQVLG